MTKIRKRHATVAGSNGAAEHDLWLACVHTRGRTNFHAGH